MIVLSVYISKVNHIDNNGCSPLFYSVTLGHVGCVKFLLDAGSKHDLQDKKGRSAAHCGAAKGQLGTLRYVITLHANQAMIFQTLLLKDTQSFWSQFVDKKWTR